MNIQGTLIKMKRMEKKYHLLKVSKQIHKRRGGLMKKKIIFTTNGILSKMSIMNYRKIKWAIKNMKMK